MKNISYNDPHILESIKKCMHLYTNDECYTKIKMNLEKSKDSLISLESLVNWNPHYWITAAEKNLKMFGKDALILVTVRDPMDYMTSIYQQKVHEGNVVLAEHFFVNSMEYSQLKSSLCERKLEYFDVDSFDLSKLHKIYSDRFNKVIFVPYKKISEMKFLKEIYNLSDNQTKKLHQRFIEKPAYNRAYSSFGMKLTIFRERIYNSLGVKSIGSNDNNILLAMRTNDNNKQNQNTATINRSKYITYTLLFLLKKISRPLYSLFNWRHFIQNRLDKIIPYSKYKLPNNIYLNNNLIAKNRSFLTDLENGRSLLL